MIDDRAIEAQRREEMRRNAVISGWKLGASPTAGRAAAAAAARKWRRARAAKDVSI